MRIKIKSMNDNRFAVCKSSKAIHELYIPVVKVEILKKETVPKSDKVSIDTKERPTTMAGLAEGKIILKKLCLVFNPRFLLTSIRLCD